MNQFATTLSTILNHGALNLALAIGYKNRIFDRLEEQNRPLRAAEIAGATELNERYLREWLGIMVTGDILELSQTENGQKLYFLPAERAALLTRKAGSSNLGVYTQEIPMLTACAMEAVQQGMKTGAGVPFSQYPDFQHFMAELSDAKLEKMLVNVFLLSVDEGRLIQRLEQGIQVCDLGCGHGVAVQLMAEAFPKSRFLGIDNHESVINEAKAMARRLGLENAAFEVLDAATLLKNKALFQSFDYICAFDAIHDQSHPLEALKGIRAMLAPGGLFSMVDIKADSNLADNLDHPMGPFLYTVSLMHCLPVGLNDNGTGLGMMWGREQAEEFLRSAGFEDISVLDMEYDPFNLHYLCRV